MPARKVHLLSRQKMKRLITLTGFIVYSFFTSAQVKVDLIRKHGVLFIPCTVNGVAMEFVFDTGASDVLISEAEMNKLIKNGSVTDRDIIGTRQYQIANGDIIESTVVNIRNFDIGGVLVKNIPASVSIGLSAPMLLGTSTLERFGSFE